MPHLPLSRATVTALTVTILLAALAAAGCGPVAAQAPAAHPAPVRTDVPEPATAPPVTRQPAGTVVPLPGEPEGLAVDARDGILAAGIREPAPGGLALVSTATGRVRSVIRLAGAPRHLGLAGPAGPVLVPLEGPGRLVQVALPGGRVVASTQVGHQPHDAAAARAGRRCASPTRWPSMRRPAGCSWPAGPRTSWTSSTPGTPGAPA